MATVQHRIGVIFGLFFLLLVLAAARTLYLGTVRAGTLRKAAQTQQLSTETLPAQRGTITDRNGVDLAVSELAQEISATPYLVKDPLEASQQLAPLLGLTQAQVLGKLSEHTGFVYLARALPAGQARKVMALKLEGITGTPTMRRVYPRGTLAAQVLGFVGTEGKGLSGLEYSQDSLLKGTAGERRVVSDALGQPISITNVHAEDGGATLTLTLDANIQQRTEDVLNAVGQDFDPERCDRDRDGPAHRDAAGGGQLAAGEPNDPAASPRPSGRRTGRWASATNRARRSRSSRCRAAWKAGLITPNTPFDIPDQIQVADRTIHDAEEHPDETLTIAEILAQSSNVGAIQIGEREGAPTFNRWVHATDSARAREWDCRARKQGVALRLSEYSGSSMGNLPIGQGELVTPMQMVTAYSAIANGGILRPPHIVGAIDGRPQPELAGHRVISQTTATELRTDAQGRARAGRHRQRGLDPRV